MTIELKYIACYLPYGLRFISEMDKPYGDCGKQPNWTLNGVSEMFGDYCLLTKENSDAYAIQSCKPILRPLSDLTKEIEYNGEKFVPIDRIDWGCLEVDHAIESDGIRFYNSEDWNAKTEEYTKPFAIINFEDLRFTEWHIMEMLFELHFDVFGLIDAGLAIDINTLQP